MVGATATIRAPKRDLHSLGFLAACFDLIWRQKRTCQMEERLEITELYAHTVPTGKN